MPSLSRRTSRQAGSIATQVEGLRGGYSFGRAYEAANLSKLCFFLLYT